MEPAGAVAPAVYDAYVWGPTNVAETESRPVGPRRLLEFPVCMPDFRALGVVPKQVASGSKHTLLLDADGKVWAWGNNSHGQLGINPSVCPFTYQWTEVRSLSGKRVSQLACGRVHSLGLTALGAVYSWGGNKFGQLGARKTKKERWQPAPVPRVCRVRQVAASADGSFAVDRTGDVYSWGSIRSGCLGLGTDGLNTWDMTYQDPVVPQKVAFFEEQDDEIEEIACGAEHMLARSGRQVYACGLNEDGRLGVGGIRDRVTPSPVELPDVEGEGAPRIFTSQECSFAITVPVEGGHTKSWCWGKLGRTKDADVVDVPTRLPNLEVEPVTQILGGKGWHIALTEDGRLYTWGKNDKNGTLGLTGDAEFVRDSNKRLPTEMKLLTGRFVDIVTCASSYCIAFVDVTRSTVKDQLLRVPRATRYPRSGFTKGKPMWTDDRVKWKHEIRRKLFRKTVAGGQSVDQCSDTEDDGCNRLKLGTRKLRSGDEVSVWVGDVWAWARVARQPRDGWEEHVRPGEGQFRLQWMRKDWEEQQNVELRSEDETSDDGNQARWLNGWHQWWDSDDEDDEDDEGDRGSGDTEEGAAAAAPAAAAGSGSEAAEGGAASGGAPLAKRRRVRAVE